MLTYKVQWVKDAELQELREKNRKLQFEEPGMRTARERWTTKQTAVRGSTCEKRISPLTCGHKASKKVLKEDWQKKLAQIEQRRNDLLPERRKDAEVVPDQGLEDRVPQSRKNTIKLTTRNEQARIEIVKLQEVK